VSRSHEYEIGRMALAHNVPCITTLSGAAAAVRGIMSLKNNTLTVCSLQEYHKKQEPGVRSQKTGEKKKAAISKQ
jgi:hypothetical protein